MSSEQKKDNPSRYVTHKSCQAKHMKIDLALFGEDGRGGIVKDITVIKAATSTVKTVVVPVVVAVATAVITYLLLNGV